MDKGIKIIIIISGIAAFLGLLLIPVRKETYYPVDSDHWREYCEEHDIGFSLEFDYDSEYRSIEFRDPDVDISYQLLYEYQENGSFSHLNGNILHGNPYVMMIPNGCLKKIPDSDNEFELSIISKADIHGYRQVVFGYFLPIHYTITRDIFLSSMVETRLLIEVNDNNEIVILERESDYTGFNSFVRESLPRSYRREICGEY
jgi:hypothetical protein